MIIKQIPQALRFLCSIAQQNIFWVAHHFSLYFSLLMFFAFIIEIKVAHTLHRKNNFHWNVAIFMTHKENNIFANTISYARPEYYDLFTQINCLISLILAFV